MLLAHESWEAKGIFEMLKEKARDSAPPLPAPCSHSPLCFPLHTACLPPPCHVPPPPAASRVLPQRRPPPRASAPPSPSRAQAAKRSLKDLTISPVLSWTTEKIQAHVDACMALPGAKLAIGGKPLTDHSIPDIYGAFEPTAVFIPLDTMLASQENFDLATTELFGPFQVFTTWKDGEMDKVLKLLNKMPNHLTAREGGAARPVAGPC